MLSVSSQRRRPGRGPVIDGGEVQNVLTVDVEEYFQVSAFQGVIPEADWPRCESRVERSVDRVLDVLGRHQTRGTFFVLGWLAAQRPGLVQRIVQAGHEVGCHSFAHRLIYSQSRAEFAQDVGRAKRTIEDAGGQGVRGYRAPSFSVVEGTLWALDVLLEQGFTYDSSIFPMRHDRYGIPAAPRHPHQRRTLAGASIWELPPATVRYLGATLPVAGGGYLRHLPPQVMQWGIQRLNHVERKPAVIYLHPWEFDPGQPRQPVGRLTAWRHYGNLDRTEERLVGLLRRFRFGTAASLLSQLEGRAVPAGRAA
jgi:polysaccharide deacetylase family protein (PEP-CTERM system associated)